MLQVETDTWPDAVAVYLNHTSEKIWVHPPGPSVVAPRVENENTPLPTLTAAWHASLFGGGAVCGLLGLAVAVLLLTTLIHTAWRTVRRRRGHRQLLDLLTRPIPPRVPIGAGCQVRLMDHRSAVAYTLPGLHARLVVSTGLVDLLTPDELPAADAPLVYHERWEQELAFDELKTHLSGRDVPIRSKTPAGVVQEVYGLVLAHYLIRRVMHDAAVTASIDPDRVSFVGTRRVLWCRLPESPATPPADWYQQLLREVRRQRLRPRRQRWYPRVGKRKMSHWNKKRIEHVQPPQPTKPFREAALVLN